MTSGARDELADRAQREQLIFNEDHEQLRQSIRAFVGKELVAHAEVWEATMFPDTVLRRMGELGYLGLDKPDAYGGQGGDFFCALVLAEELAGADSGGLAAGVAAQVDMAMPLILAFGTEEQKQEGLAAAIRGEKILCCGLNEAEAGSDVACISTQAVRDGSDWVINGAKSAVTNGHRADLMLLSAVTDAGVTLFLVPTSTPGVTRGAPLRRLGLHASDAVPVTLDDVRVSPSAVLGQAGRGLDHIAQEFQGGWIAAAAGHVARAQLCFDRTLKYSREREAFGRPIGTFQVTRHKFAYMAAKIESARQMTYDTARRFADGEGAARDVSMLRLHASRVALAVADECIQIHGGAGYMTEYGVERVWRDLRQTRIELGADEALLDVIAASYVGLS